MNIVHVCLRCFVTDGWNYQDNMITKYQKKAGHKVVIITSKWIYDNTGQIVVDKRKRYINSDGVEMVRLSMKGKEDFTRKLQMFQGLYDELVSQNPDIVFIHGVCSRDNITILKYLKSYPNVIAYADSHADFSNSATNWISKNILHKVIWRHYVNMLEPFIKRFYGVLPARVEFLKEMYKLPEEKCELLVLGADDEIVADAARPEVRREIRMNYHIKDDDFLIVTGGKIDMWKSQTILLMKAIKRIGSPKVRLLVFGSVDPKLQGQVTTLADGERIQYIGWIQAEESYKFFAASELAVFPGRHSVFWEQATAQGIPMICKEWPGIEHVDLGGNVHFLKEDSEEEILNEIIHIVNSPEEYERMKEVAVSKGMETFSYKNIALQSIS